MLCSDENPLKIDEMPAECVFVTSVGILSKIFDTVFCQMSSSFLSFLAVCRNFRMFSVLLRKNSRNFRVIIRPLRAVRQQTDFRELPRMFILRLSDLFARALSDLFVCALSDLFVRALPTFLSVRFLTFLPVRFLTFLSVRFPTFLSVRFPTFLSVPFRPFCPCAFRPFCPCVF